MLLKLTQEALGKEERDYTKNDQILSLHIILPHFCTRRPIRSLWLILFRDSHKSSEPVQTLNHRMQKAFP